MATVVLDTGAARCDSIAASMSVSMWESGEEGEEGERPKRDGCGEEERTKVSGNNRAIYLVATGNHQKCLPPSDQLSLCQKNRGQRLWRGLPLSDWKLQALRRGSGDAR